MRFFAGYLQERIGYDFYCDIAERIVEARNRNGWTQADLAKKSGLTLSKIVAMEGVKVRFTLSDIEVLAKTLKVSTDWLVDAHLDCRGAECLYLVWNERYASDRWRFYQKATSARMAFLKCHARISEHVIWFGPRDRAIVEIVGVPVNDTELKTEFPLRGKQGDDPLEPYTDGGDREEHAEKN